MHFFYSIFFHYVILIFDFRFPDTASRNAWHEVLSNSILYTNNEKSSSAAGNSFTWISGAFRSPKKIKPSSVDDKRDFANRKIIFASRSKSRNKV